MLTPLLQENPAAEMLELGNSMRGIK
jgi:hypothetical protein